MRNIIPLLIIFLHLTITPTIAQQIYKLEGDKIINSPDFVKPMVDRFCDASAYVMWDGLLNVQVGSTWYIIQVGEYTSELCGGDFNLIDIYSKDMDSKLFKVDYGILKMDETSCRWYPEKFMANYSLSDLSENGYFIELPLSETSKALIFIGRCYRTDLDRMLVFVLTEKDAEIVFNLPMPIEAFKHANGDTNILVTTQFKEWGDTVSYGNYIMHSIYTQDGVLMFNENP